MYRITVIEPNRWEEIVDLPRRLFEWCAWPKDTQSDPVSADWLMGLWIKIPAGSFLTARILWKHVPVEDLVDQSEGEMLELPPDVRKKAMDCCLQFRQFVTYCTDIEDYGGTKPKDWDWDRFDLGPFLTIRSLQFTIRRDKERLNESDDTPSLGAINHL